MQCSWKQSLRALCAPVLRPLQVCVARPDELLLAYLDDVYVTTSPERARAVFDLLSLHLHQHAHIRLHRGTARLWNASGREPPGVRELGSVEGPVWVGDRALPSEQQGLVALSAPYSSPAFVATRAKQDQLLQGIRAMPDLQSAWLLLASARCSHVLRTLPPEASLAFEESHDAAIAACVTDLLGAGPLPGSALKIAQLSFQQRGPNLCSGVALAPAAYWASWADTLPVLQCQLPRLADEILAQELSGPALLGVLRSYEALTAAAIAERLQAALLAQLDAASRALLFSQTGPFSSRPFTSVPSCPELTFSSAHLRAKKKNIRSVPGTSVSAFLRAARDCFHGPPTAAANIVCCPMLPQNKRTRLFLVHCFFRLPKRCCLYEHALERDTERAIGKNYGYRIYTHSTCAF